MYPHLRGVSSFERCDLLIREVCPHLRGVPSFERCDLLIREVCPHLRGVASFEWCHFKRCVLIREVSFGRYPL